MGEILTRQRRKSTWLIWHFRVRGRVCARRGPCFHRFETEASGRREMGILGKLLSSVSLVSIWCLLIVEPGKVQREQDHLGKKSSLYCIFAPRFHASYHFVTSSFPTICLFVNYYRNISIRESEIKLLIWKKSKSIMSFEDLRWKIFITIWKSCSFLY